MVELSGHASPAAIQGVTVAFTVLALTAIVARLLTRTLISKQAGLDDALIFIAGGFTIALCVTTYKQATYGMGKHAWEFSEAFFEKICIYFWAATWTYYAALGFTKLSILLQYLRIFPQAWFRKACYTMIVVNIIWTLWAVFSAVFMCVPVSMFWKQVTFVNSYCLNRLTVWYADAAVNIVTDCIVAFLPLPIINSLEIPRRQKSLLLLVFGMGLLTCVISVLRLAYIYPVSVSTDMTWESPLICIWSAVETNVGIMCSCMPTLKGSVQRAWPKLLDSLASARSSGPRGPSNASADSTATSKLSILLGKREKSATGSSSTSDEESGLALQREVARTALPPIQKSSSGFAKLGFRRSLFTSPFGAQTHPAHRSENCFGGAESQDSVVGSVAELQAHGSSKPGTAGSLSQLGADDRKIEVYTVVDQVSEERRAGSGDESTLTIPLGEVENDRRAESTRTMVSAGGLGRSTEEEKEIERMAWV